ncbi:MAG: hypothetical protein OWU84_04905 [Firmicutes bacterium]|nr:hypothetical protein [Bacillota bacterium]
MSITVQPSNDTEWITVRVDGGQDSETIVAVNRAVLASIVQQESRPLEDILAVISQRAIQRMPVPNSADGMRLITPYNLSLVWPT